MKKFISILSIAILCITLFIPFSASASTVYDAYDYNGLILPNFYHAEFDENYLFITSGGNAVLSNRPLDVFNTGNVTVVGVAPGNASASVYYYSINDYGRWECDNDEELEEGYFAYYLSHVLWSSYDLYNEDGQLVYPKDYVDYNGHLLPSVEIGTYSENYYAVFEMPGSNDTTYYLLTVSTVPLTYNDTFGTVTNKEDMQLKQFYLSSEHTYWYEDGDNDYEAYEYEQSSIRLIYSSTLEPIKPDEPDTPDTPEVDTPTMCDGTVCPLADYNNDNFCDICSLPVTFAFRNDTYNFNGSSFPITMEMSDGTTQTIHEFVETNNNRFDLSARDNVVILSSGEFTGSLLYYFAQEEESTVPIYVKDNNVVTYGNTTVTLYVAAYTEEGTPYWDYSGTGVWNSSGAYVSSMSQVWWVADDLTDYDGNVQLSGDPNFQPPLAERVTALAVETILGITIPELVRVMTIILLCGVGCLALVIVLNLFGKRSLIFRR